MNIEMRTRLFATLNLLGLFFGVIGGIVLFYSLALRSSNYRLVEKSDHGVAICLNDKVVEGGFGGPLIVSDKSCPQSIEPSLAPVIEAHRPVFVPLGLVLICLGFGLQLPAAQECFLERQEQKEAAGLRLH
jgi:hypothetical protein